MLFVMEMIQGCLSIYLKHWENQDHPPLDEAPVSCRTRNIPLPSSMLFVFRIPMTLFGRGLGFELMSCFVGLILRVGFKPPPVICLNSAASPPAAPVN